MKIWISNPEYLPETGVHAYKEFTTLDAGHLICNISARLGKSHGGHKRSMFVKKIFAETCKDLENLAIYKNMKYAPTVGNIKIDEPVKGNFDFHYQSEDEQ